MRYQFARLERFADGLACSHVPTTDILTPQEQGLAVRTERHGRTPTVSRLPFQLAEELARVHLPQPGRSVRASRGNSLAVRTERRGLHDVLMHQGLTEAFARRCVPQADREPAPGKDLFAV